MCQVAGSSNATESTNNIQVNSSIWSQPPIRLPQLEIIPFDGDILKRQEFWNQFEAPIHNASYPSINTFNYLRSCLKSISGLHSW